MERKDDDLLLFTLIAAFIRDDIGEDPYLNDWLFRMLRRRGDLERGDPELRHILERVMRGPRLSRRRSEMREIANAVVDGFRGGFKEEIDGRLREFSARIEEVAASQGAFSKVQDADKNDLLRTKDTIHGLLWLLESGADVRKAKSIRYVPVRIFLGDPVPDEAAREALVSRVEDFVKPIDLERAYDIPEESGSWWKRIVLRSKKLLTHEEVQKRLKKAERTLEVKYLDKPQAEANHLQAQAAAGLIGALGTTPNACIQVGTLLLVKATDCDGKSAIVARTLNDQELRMLEENQSVLRKPDAVLEFLQSPPRAVNSDRPHPP